MVESWLFEFLDASKHVSEVQQLIWQSEEGKSKCLSATSVFCGWWFQQLLPFSVFGVFSQSDIIM